MTNKQKESRYKNMSDYVVCVYYNTKILDDTKIPEYTVGEKYKIQKIVMNNHLLHIINNYGIVELFHIHSPFAENFCSEYYLRNKKLIKLNLV